MGIKSKREQDGGDLPPYAAMQHECYLFFYYNFHLVQNSSVHGPIA